MKINNKGFTLIEILLYILIVGVMLSAVIPFFMGMLQINAKNMVEQEVNANLKDSIEKIKYEIKNAKALDAINSDFGVNLASNSSYQLNLSTSGATDPTIINIVSGVIYIKRGAGLPIAISSNKVNISNLTFTNNSLGNTANITFEITAQSNYDQQTTPYQFTTSLRGSVEMR